MADVGERPIGRDDRVGASPSRNCGQHGVEGSESLVLFEQAETTIQVFGTDWQERSEQLGIAASRLDCVGS